MSAPIRAVLLVTSSRGVDGDHIDPFERWRAALSERFGFTFERLDIGRRRALEGREPPDLVFVQDREHDLDVVATRLRALRGLGPSVQVVFLDPYASTYGRSFRLLPLVDVYVKKSLFRDRDRHGECFLDGRVFADHIIRTQGLTPHFRGAVRLDARYASRVMLGWNVGAGKRLVDRLLDTAAMSSCERPIDVHCRVQTGAPKQPNWYIAHRQRAIDLVRTLADRYRVVATDDRIAREAFISEVEASKVTISPFGFGEVCIRDFEAVAAGSLLLKPSMAHLETQPDIYRPGETYVPLAWDLSDLRAQCVRYLDDHAARARIVANARAAYTAFFRNATFVDVIGAILERVGLR